MADQHITKDTTLSLLIPRKSNQQTAVTSTMTIDGYTNQEGTMPDKALWKYENSRGIPCKGTVEQRVQGQGSDVTYQMRNVNGTLECISGSSLETLERIYPTEYAQENKTEDK